MTWIGKHQRCCPETINPGWLLSDTCHAAFSGRRLRGGKNFEIVTACYNMIQLSWNLQLGNVNPPNDEQWEKKQLFGLQYSNTVYIRGSATQYRDYNQPLIIYIYKDPYQPTSIVECNKGIFTAQRGAMNWHLRKTSLTFRNLACPFVRCAWEMYGLLEKARGVCKLHRYLVFRHSSRWGDPPLCWLWNDYQNMLVLEPSSSYYACGRNGMSQTCKKCLDKKT